MIAKDMGHLNALSSQFFSHAGLLQKLACSILEAAPHAQYLQGKPSPSCIEIGRRPKDKLPKNLVK